LVLNILTWMSFGEDTTMRTSVDPKENLKIIDS